MQEVYTTGVFFGTAPIREGGRQDGAGGEVDFQAATSEASADATGNSEARTALPDLS